MTFPLRWLPLQHPADRSRRLVQLVLAGGVLLLLLLWNPITMPGPVLCMSRRAFALPCPFCGITRGVALCLRGQPLAGCAYNPLTLPVFVVGLALMGLWVLEYLRNARLALTLSGPGRWLAHGLLFVVLIANWIWLLVYNREDDFAHSWLGGLVHLFW